MGKDKAMKDLNKRINILIRQGNWLSNKLRKAKRMMSTHQKHIRNLWDPNDVTKKQIRDLLDKKPNLDQVDIADELNLDLEVVCRMCDELLAEHKIKSIPYQRRKNKL